MADTSEQPTETSFLMRATWAVIILVLGAIVGYFVYATTVNTDSRFPFKLGLDLAGGSQLVYEADVSLLPEEEIDDAMGVLREVIEQRINVFGVSEPIVQVERSSVFSQGTDQRLIVELPGVTDIEEAVAAIGETPLLEFKLVNPEIPPDDLDIQIMTADGSAATATPTTGGERYEDTGLTGRYLDRAQLVFGQASGGVSNEPIVQIDFDSEGAELFAAITRDNVGRQLAIFLDGVSISEPVIQQSIPGGTATISGNFTPDEARALVRNLNFGALPIPIELASTQTIGASLGAQVLEHGITAGMIGFGLVMLFMVMWYRLPGVIAVIALSVYLLIMFALFKLIPVTLTAAGLAGLILSIGMAVDANVLVFGRMKEEYEAGKDSREAARAGFARAWTAIRDGNVTSILSAAILFWFGTSIVKGFALVFGLGVIISMVTALTVTRTLLMVLPVARAHDGGLLAGLYESGITWLKKK